MLENNVEQCVPLSEPVPLGAFDPSVVTAQDIPVTNNYVADHLGSHANGATYGRPDDHMWRIGNAQPHSANGQNSAYDANGTQAFFDWAMRNSHISHGQDVNDLRAPPNNISLNVPEILLWAPTPTIHQSLMSNSMHSTRVTPLTDIDEGYDTMRTRMSNDATVNDPTGTTELDQYSLGSWNNEPNATSDQAICESSGSSWVQTGSDLLETSISPCSGSPKSSLSGNSNLHDDFQNRQIVFMQPHTAQTAGYKSTSPDTDTVFPVPERGKNPKRTAKSSRRQSRSCLKKVPRALAKKTVLVAGSKDKPTQRQKGKLSADVRARTGAVRRQGTCVRCHLFGEKCGLNFPCDNCAQKLSSARGFKEPCYREQLDNIALARHGNGRMNQHHVAFLPFNWYNLDQQSRSVEITWTIPTYRCELPVPLSTTCQKFVPRCEEEQDIKMFWSHQGRSVEITTTPFAVYDTNELQTSVNDFLAQNNDELERAVEATFERSDVLRATYAEAKSYAARCNSDLIPLAIRIRCASLASQGWGSLTGYDTLGMTILRTSNTDESAYEKYQQRHDIPIPQSIGHQIDVAIVLHSKHLQRELIKQLKKRIFGKPQKREFWYEIFLTMFILLSNSEYIHEGACQYRNSKRRTQLASRVSAVVEKQIGEYEYSASNMLHHFRFVLRGCLPFDIAEHDPKELRKMAGLDDAAIEYMRRVTKMRRAREQIIPHDLNDNPETRAGRWLNQLFQEQWGTPKQ